MKTIIEAHKFFMRKSQHFIMGNWSEYEKENFWNRKLGFLPKNKNADKNYIKYKLYFPIAYVKFMWSVLTNH